MEQPKKSPNSYVCFINEKRAELFKQVPAGEKPSAWVAKKAGEMWKAMSEEEQAPYVAEAARLHKIFEADREKFIAQGGVMTKTKRKSKGDVKDVEVENSSSSPVVHVKEIEQPKMLPHACVCFMNEKFASLFMQVPAGQSKVAWVGKQAAEMWKALCEAERAPYLEQAENILKAFDEEFEKCDSQGVVAAKDPAVQSSSSSTAPQGMEEPKRPLNPSAIFMNEKRPELKGQVPAGEKAISWIMKKLGEQWKALSDEERAPYVAQSKENKKKYKEELAKFTAQGGVLKKRKVVAQDGKPKRRKTPKDSVDDCEDPAAEKSTQEDVNKEEEEEVEDEEEETREVGEEAKEAEEEDMLMAGLETVLQEDAPAVPA